eukprot:GFUD01051601.1.p1 GENE.GFUD01051601.1~~GFUD01051601.1.p1  ORF type:complete len:157 (-),score=20.13 GFUD01051601.1:184-654(-)
MTKMFSIIYGHTLLLLTQYRYAKSVYLKKIFEKMPIRKHTKDVKQSFYEDKHRVKTETIISKNPPHISVPPLHKSASQGHCVNPFMIFRGVSVNENAGLPLKQVPSKLFSRAEFSSAGVRLKYAQDWVTVSFRLSISFRQWWMSGRHSTVVKLVES